MLGAVHVYNEKAGYPKRGCYEVDKHLPAGPKVVVHFRPAALYFVFLRGPTPAAYIVVPIRCKVNIINETSRFFTMNYIFADYFQIF